MTAPRIDRLSETPKALAHLVAELSDEALDAAAAGEWSPRTILAHLRDDEYLCARPWIARALVEDNPRVQGIGGDAWEATRNRSRDRKEWLLADFALQRQASISILRMLRPDDWNRTIDRRRRAACSPSPPTSTPGLSTTPSTSLSSNAPSAKRSKKSAPVEPAWPTRSSN